jgi:hypothetical protein
MDRVTKTALATGCAAVLFLAVVAAVVGYLDGAGASGQHPPGLEGAVANAMIATVFVGWAAFGLGAVAGAGAAMASSLAGRLRRCWRPPA